MQLKSFREGIYFILLVIFFCSSCCHPKSQLIEPSIVYCPPQRVINRLAKPFDSLKPKELLEPWAREYYIGNQFAKEFDLYRAITAYKRSLILLPLEKEERQQQLEYKILLAYYLGGKYQSVIEWFEKSSLRDVSETFSPYKELLFILYDSYNKLERQNCAQAIWRLIDSSYPDIAKDLMLGETIQNGDVKAVESYLFCDSSYKEESKKFFQCFKKQKKSVRQAQMLNALLPGAGYYYVGQKKSAVTSFLLNALFIAAAYRFFERNHIAAGVITTGFEIGWYLGGINGAGLAAKEYNECLWNRYGKEIMLEEKLFPVLKFEVGF